MFFWECYKSRPELVKPLDSVSIRRLRLGRVPPLPPAAAAPTIRQAQGGAAPRNATNDESFVTVYVPYTSHSGLARAELGGINAICCAVQNGYSETDRLRQMQQGTMASFML